MPTAARIPIRLTTVISSPIENPRMSARTLLQDFKVMNAIETDNLCDSALKVARNATYKCEQKLYQIVTTN